MKTFASAALALVALALVWAAPGRAHPGDPFRDAARPSGWTPADAAFVRNTPGEPLGHKHLEAEHRLLSADQFGGASPSFAPRPGHLLDTHVGPRVTREVMGYLPYWSYSAAAPYVPARWDMLTILAWFSVEIDGTGAITNRRGWGGQTTAKIVQDAHLQGVKVIITITNFDGSQIASIVNSAANRRRAIDNCLMLMGEHSADGINIDFEFVPKSARDGFVTFMTELKDAVRAANPNGWEGHVSLAGPAVDWNGAYDYDVLLENTDGIMVMAYGYHWSGSNPGPNSPLFTGDVWSGRSISWTVDDYLTYGGAENRHKVLMGLPWYGRDWKVNATTIPGTSAGAGSSRTFKVAEPEALALGKGWEDVSKSVYYHRNANNQLYQVWYDDRRSLEEKIAYVDSRDLGGIGIWALGYEGPLPDLWLAIEAVFGVVDPGPDADPEPGPELAEPGPEAVEPTEPPTEEAVAEPDPEPGSEVSPDTVSPDTGPPAEVSPDAHDGMAHANTPTRSVALREREGEGCAGGSGAPWSVALAAVFILAARRRGRPSALELSAPLARAERAAH